MLYKRPQDMLNFINEYIFRLWNNDTIDNSTNVTNNNSSWMEYFNRSVFVKNLTNLQQNQGNVSEINSQYRNVIHLAVLNDMFEEVKDILNQNDVLSLATAKDIFGQNAIEYDIKSNKYNGALTKFIASKLYCTNSSNQLPANEIEQSVQKSLIYFYLDDGNFKPNKITYQNCDALSYSVLHNDEILLSKLLEENNKFKFSKNSIDNAINILVSYDSKSIYMWQKLIRAKIDQGGEQKWFQEIMKNSFQKGDSYFTYHLLEQVISHIPKSYFEQLYFITIGLKSYRSINFTNLFLNNGINLQTKDSNGRTACEYAKFSHNDYLKSFLCDKDQDHQSFFTQSADYLRSQYIEFTHNLLPQIGNILFNCSQPTSTSTTSAVFDSLILFVQMMGSKTIGKGICDYFNLDPKKEQNVINAVFVSLKVFGKDYLLEHMLYYLNPNRFFKDYYCSTKNEGISMTFDEAVIHTKTKQNLYISTFNCKEHDHKMIAEIDHLDAKWSLCEAPTLSTCIAEYYL